MLWLVEALMRSGHHCVIAARPGEPLALRATERGIRVVPCSPRWEFDGLAIAQLSRFVRREGIQIVHAHTAHAASIAFFCGPEAKLVITRRVDFALRRNWLSRLKYRRAAAIIAISEAVADVLATSGVDPARIEVIPSGVDLSRPLPQPDRKTLRQLGIPEGTLLVVMVAALVDHKDPVTFVRAMKNVVDALPDSQALLIGDGPLRPVVKRSIEQLELAKNVHLAGYRADADALMAAADVVVLSSRQEGLGTVLIDALWMGKAIAATCAGGIPEIVEDARCGLLSPPEDAAALGSSIIRLLGDSALRARFGAAGVARATAFSVEQTASRTALVYQRVSAIEHEPAALHLARRG